MAAVKTLARDEEAPDPLDLARAESEGMGSHTRIPGMHGDEPSMAQALMMIAEALATLKAGDSGANERLAGIERFLLNQEQTRPHENLFNPPMISWYNPEGERDHPRPDLQCKIIQNGMDLRKDTLSKEEILLWNRVQPGVFWVTKADGRRIRFAVTEKVDDAGRREHLWITFPCKNPDDRQNHQGIIPYLREILGDETSITRETLLAEVAAMKAELAQHVATA